MSNPFHEGGSYAADRTRRHRENVRIGVYAVAVTAGVFLAGMLIQGCRANRAAGELDSGAAVDSATNGTTSTLTAEGLQPQTNAPAPPTAAVATPPIPEPVNAQAAPAPPVPNERSAPPAAPTQDTYLIKPGDSLSRIAKAHGMTVQALKAANGLKSDRIVAGKKLKLPQASAPATPAA